jgi:hypothetical protein
MNSFCAYLSSTQLQEEIKNLCFFFPLAIMSYLYEREGTRQSRNYEKVSPPHFVLNSHPSHLSIRYNCVCIRQEGAERSKRLLKHFARTT